MTTLTFKTNSEFKQAFNTPNGNVRDNQLELSSIKSINGIDVNIDTYTMAITNITHNHGVQSFNDDVKVSAPYEVTID